MSNPSVYRTGQFEKPRTYAVKHKDYNVRMASRSGGFFTAISDKILQDGGIVYGCVMENNTTAVHIRADNKNDRNKMRGSKYIQSEVRDAFQKVHDDLEAGKWVLLSGTSCQVAGLKAFLKRDYANLLTVDIVCHGVPSPLVWNQYLHWQEEKNGNKVIGVDFRNKKDFGWASHVESLYLENGKQVNSDIFKTLFYGHTILRPACYQCPYKDIIHPGDITIADYWGVAKAAPEFDDDKGVSLVLINNSKGQVLFDSVADQVETVETRIEDSMQTPLRAPFPKPSNRERFWQELRKFGFSRVVKTYGTTSKKILLKRKIKKLLKGS